jgi:hypothetical protein
LLHPTDDDAVACNGGGEFASPLHPDTNAAAASRLNSTPLEWALATEEAYRKRRAGKRPA